MPILRAVGSPARSRRVKSREDRNELALANAGLVGYVARGYVGRGLDMEELRQIGWHGLLRAAELWDPARGKFPTYAVLAIKRRIQRALLRNRLMPIPDHVARRFLESGEDIADRYPAPASLDRRRMGATSLLEMVANPAAADPADVCVRLEVAAQMRALINRLPRGERLVIDWHYGLTGRPMTLAEIAAARGVSPTSVSTAHSRALKRLRAFLGERRGI